MKLSVFISSAVESHEKECVKKKLEDMKNIYSPYIDFDIYDCAEHGTTWSTFSKQDIIDHKIPFVDWFVCLVPEWTVGKNTWEELEHILKLHKDGLPVVISVFHPNECPQTDKTAVPEGKVTFDFIMEESKKILGNEKAQYWVDYKYGDKENLTKSLFDQFKTLYYTDKVFRIQRLDRFAKFGREIKARDIYFDKERAERNNGFYENKYFPRNSVDGILKQALIDEQRKFIILNGAPASGKTRALYQLLVSPAELALDKHKQYALGTLSDSKVIVIQSENVLQVYEFLKSESEYDFSMQPSCEYYLVCDQLNNVFDNRMSNNDIYDFFDIVSKNKHIRMIATSIPSAYEKFCARWEGYGYKPLKDDYLTKVITIPQISSDEEGEEIRIWMWNELKGNSAAETIGDFIPQLNNYKKTIVNRLYDKMSGMPYLSKFLSAVQIIETFRYDTALFLPVLFMKKNNEEFDISKTVEVINYLISNNVIWVWKKTANGQAQTVITSMKEADFSLEYDIDPKDDFIFDNETFKDTALSTAYTYEVNEIIWDEIEHEDPNRRNQGESTLLRNFNDNAVVVRVPKEFHRAFPSISSLRRILPRIPHSDCYEDAFKEIWNYVYEKLQGIDRFSNDNEKDEFLITVGMLIGRSQGIDQIGKAINIIQEKELKPDYGIIGELYSAGVRLEKKSDIKEIVEIVEKIRKIYSLHNDSYFSLERKINFSRISFDDALKKILDKDFLSFNKAEQEDKNKLDIINIERLVSSLAKRGDTIEQWNKVFELHRTMKIKIQRSLIRNYFSAVAIQEKKQRQETNNLSSEDLLSKCLHSFYEEYNDIIADEDKESCFYYAIGVSCNFSQSHSLYKFYVETFNNDNQRLISMVLLTVLDHEYQKALFFLIETKQKFEKRKHSLNDICFNNLIKSAPNKDEALEVIPHITNLQDYTISNILSLLKSKRFIKDSSSITGTKQDPKIFYYAYSVVMREDFTELRKSPYIIGLLYDLATTPKHERFIREKLLEGFEESKKCEIIDYSTSISSIRLKKNYRTLDEVWVIFEKCRNRYKVDNLFIKSELYSSMIRKLKFLCKTDEFKTHQEKLNRIIQEDYDRIIRDEFFIPSLYRFLPDKKVVDDNGNISANFIREMRALNLSIIRPLNTIMAELKTEGFDIVWKFYEFIVDYYQEKGKHKSLRPDIRTITYLMEAIETEEQFECVEEISKKWGLFALLRRNTIYNNIRNSKREALGLSCKNNKKSRGHNNENGNLWTNEDRINSIIKSVEKDINLYGCITPTRFNQHLRTFGDIIQKVNGGKSKRTRTSTIEKYSNALVNLLNKYDDKICYNALSYLYLIKFTPEIYVDRWIKELRNKREIYQYDFVACAAIAQSAEICDKDIDLSLEYYKSWEAITNDIGYNPTDTESFSEETAVKIFEGIEDYDGYWLTRHSHCKCEMYYYYNHLKDNKDDVKRHQILCFIKQQIKSFEQFGIPAPRISIRGEFVDIKREIESE